MEIQFIYTFEHMDQIMIDGPFDLHFLESKSELIRLATLALSDEEKADLIKISSCIFCESEDDHKHFPDWFIKQNGKLWLDDLDEWREANGVKSSISSNFHNEWYAENSNK